jgi:hypothetical protein
VAPHREAPRDLRDAGLVPLLIPREGVRDERCKPDVTPLSHSHSVSSSAVNSTEKHRIAMAIAFHQSIVIRCVYGRRINDEALTFRKTRRANDDARTDS